MGSVVVEGNARSRQRDGFMLIALAVCGWCLGFALTDWFCDSDQQGPVASQDEIKAVALQRASTQPLTAADASRRAPPIAAEDVVAPATTKTAAAAAADELASLVPAVVAAEPPAAAPLPAAKQAPAPKRAPVARNWRSAPARKLAATEEPSPALSPEEVKRVFVLAAATKYVFASVDESGPNGQVSVQHSPAANVAEHEAGKVVAIESLYVEGALPSTVVNRGVQRLLPQYDRCREFCDSAPQRMKLSTTIDEAGHGRQVIVEGLSRPGLRRCLEQATAHLVVPAPDTGTARARWVVHFAR